MWPHRKYTACVNINSDLIAEYDFECKHNTAIVFFLSTTHEMAGHSSEFYISHMLLSSVDFDDNSKTKNGPHKLRSYSSRWWPTFEYTKYHAVRHTRRHIEHTLSAGGCGQDWWTSIQRSKRRTCAFRRTKRMPLTTHQQTWPKSMLLGCAFAQFISTLDKCSAHNSARNATLFRLLRLRECSVSTAANVSHIHVLW